MTPPKHTSATPETPVGDDLPNDANIDAADHSLPDDKPSKSELKRQMHALQDMGSRLADMPAHRLEEMPVSETLREAIQAYQHIKPRAREGRRRQLQLIGKLMRHEDTDAIGAMLEQERQEHRAVSLAQQQIVDWRNRLLEDDQALQSFITEHKLDNEFRTLARKARREREAGKDPHTQRALFRTLQKILSE